MAYGAEAGCGYGNEAFILFLILILLVFGIGFGFYGGWGASYGTQEME